MHQNPYENIHLESSLDPSVPPLFSVVTVTKDACADLERTMRSVDAQNFPFYEHLIIDGASTDGTDRLPALSANPRRRFRSAPDRGVYFAMNKGLAQARGSYVLFLNAGDCLHAEDTLHRLYELIMDNDFPGVVYGQTDIVDSEGHRLGSRHLTAPQNLTLKSFSKGMLVCHQAFVALRKLTGPYDTSYRFSADYDWCVRILQHSRRNVYADCVIADYLNEGLTTRNHRRSLRERYRIMCRYYGTLPTALRHIGFAFRAMRRKIRGK